MPAPDYFSHKRGGSIGSKRSTVSSKRTRAGYDIFALVAREVYLSRREEEEVAVATRPSHDESASGSRTATEAAAGSEDSSNTLYTLSLVSRRWRQAALQYLMRGVFVKGDWVECDHALARLSQMKVARHVRRFTLIVTLKASSLPRRPPPNMPSQLSTLLHSMTRAYHLGLSLPSYYSPLFSENLRRTNHLDESLRRVRSVCIGVYCEWLVKLCANVEQVVAMQRPESGDNGWALDTKLNPAARMLQTMNGSSSLGSLELATEWSVVLVEVVRRSAPALQEFGMLGEVPLGDVLPTLGRFKRLTHLSLSDVRRLRVVLDKRKDMDAAHKVASMCAVRIGTLQSITVGDHMFDVIRTARGKFIRTERKDL